MQRTYYVGEGQEAKALIDAAMAKVQRFRDAANALLEGMPDGTMLLACNGGIGPVIGFGIPQELTADAIQYCGIHPEARYPDGAGNVVQGYKPNGRSKKGKELRQRMNAANKLHTTFSDEVVKALRIDRWFLDGRMMHSSSVGCNDDKLFVSIPGSPDDGREHLIGINKFPTIPAWFRTPQGNEAMFFLNGK